MCWVLIEIYCVKKVAHVCIASARVITEIVWRMGVPQKAVFSVITSVWFLFGEVSSSTGCLGWAALFYCGTP